MTSITVEFFASPGEVVALIGSAVEKHGLLVVSFQGQPFNVEVVSLDRFLESKITKDNLNRFYLGMTTPELEASSQGEFCDKNPSMMVLDIGKLTDKWLKQSTFQVWSDDEKTLKVARSIAREIKKQTKAGVGVLNPTTGDTGYNRVKRFTEEAKKLYLKGIKILPVAGGVEFLLDAPKP